MGVFVGDVLMVEKEAIDVTIEQECSICNSMFEISTNVDGMPLEGDYGFKNLMNMTVWYCSECR